MQIGRFRPLETRDSAALGSLAFGTTLEEAMAINYHDGGGNDPYSPDFTRIQVEPTDLAEFADLLDGDIRAIRETWERLWHDMRDPNFPGTTPAQGTTGIPEGAALSDAYYKTFRAHISLMRDLIRGLEVLRDAARDTHEAYLRTDAANAGDVADPFENYEPWQVTEAFREQTRPSGSTTGPS